MLTADFFAAVRTTQVVRGAHITLFRELSQTQVNSLNAICTAFDSFTGHDHCADDLAYVMATCYRECGPSLNLGIREGGLGQGKPYGKPAGPFKQIYYGRGPVQETWLANYTRSEKRTGIPFVQYPDRMCDPRYGLINMLDGMYNGLFTKRSLRNYITPGVATTYEQFVRCRAIVNGADHAGEIALNAMCFQIALTKGYLRPATVAVPVRPPQTSIVGAILAAIAALFGKKTT